MSQQLPPELARRIAALEQQPAAADLDRAGWLWLTLLGVLLPVALLILGWLI